MKPRETLLAVLLVGLSAGCTTVGTGQRTVVRAGCDDFAATPTAPAEPSEQQLCNELAARYPHLVAPTNTVREQRTLRIDADGRPIDPSKLHGETTEQPSYQSFLNFLKLKYGSETFKPVLLSFTAHDRTNTPPFLSVDPRPTLLPSLSTLFLSTQADLSTEKKIELQDLLDARVRNVPDLGPTTSLHQAVVCGEGCRPDFKRCVSDCLADKTSGKPLTEKECNDSCSAAGDIYFYYPRVSVDFSSGFLSTTATDRLSYMAMLVRLREPAGSSQKVRFLDFKPKEADIAAFSRGDLTESAQLQASANAGLTGSEGVKVTKDSTEKTTGSGNSAGASTGISATETFATKLADAIEKKTTGILDDGQTFFADFRSIRDIRVAGAYNFDLMLEVPSTPSRTVQDGVPSDVLESVPIQTEVKADIFLLGVVRQVHERGRIGVLNSVPESENDHVFEQVVLRVIPNQSLWIAPNINYTFPLQFKEPACKLQVVTNREDAGFVVKNGTGSTIANGTGRKADLSFPPAEGACGSVSVTFFPVVLTQEGIAIVLEAKAERVDFKDSNQQAVEGTYRPIEKK